MASEMSGQYECMCPEGYYGVTCEHRDPCLPNPCQHGGSCTNLTHTSFSCVCPSGYTGEDQAGYQLIATLTKQIEYLVKSCYC